MAKLSAGELVNLITHPIRETGWVAIGAAIDYEAAYQIAYQRLGGEFDRAFWFWSNYGDKDLYNSSWTRFCLDRMGLNGPT